MARRKDIPPTLLDDLRKNLERLKLRAMLAHLDEALEQAIGGGRKRIHFRRDGGSTWSCGEPGLRGGQPAE